MSAVVSFPERRPAQAGYVVARTPDGGWEVRYIKGGRVGPVFRRAGREDAERWGEMLLRIDRSSNQAADAAAALIGGTAVTANLLPAPIRPKLGKLVPLLGSDRDGEVIATVRAIGRTLRSAHLDFNDLAGVIERKISRIEAGLRTIDGERA